MAAAFSISVIGAKSIIRNLRKGSRKMDSEIRKNLLKGGSIIQAAAKKNFKSRGAKGTPNLLVGPKTLRVQSGQLRRSIRVLAKGQGANTVVTIGPTVVYGAIHELGGEEFKSAIPKRPYMGPALEESAEKVVAIVGRSFRPILEA